MSIQHQRRSRIQGIPPNAALLPGALMVLVLTSTVFANALQGGFVWDDLELVLENRFIRSLSSARFFFTPHYWRECHTMPGMAYKPVTMGSFALDYKLWALEPWGYRLTNLALHAANALLLFAFLRRLRMSPGVSLWAALLFAVHPIHVEAVDWVKNRADLLCFTFSLLTFILFVSALTEGPTEGRGALGRGRRYAACLAAFALALASKGSAIAFCPLSSLYVLLFLPRPRWRKALTASLAFWILAAAYLTCLSCLVKSEVIVVSSPGLDLFRLGRTALAYGELAALPTRLAADRVVPSEIAFSLGTGLGLVLALVAACLCADRPRRPAALLALSWAVVALIPALHLTPISPRPLAEQRLYMSSAGICLLLALGLQGAGWLRGRKVLAPVLMLSLAAGATRRNFAWLDDYTFWHDAVVKSPGLARPTCMLAGVYLARGLPDRTLVRCRKVVALRPDYVLGQNMRGLAFLQKGRLDDAISAFRAVLAADPEDAAAHDHLAHAYAAKGDIQAAIREWQATLKLAPGHMRAHQNLGAALERHGRLEEAVWEYRQAVGLSPSNDAVVFCAVARLKRRLGQPDEAAAYYRKSLSAVPEYAPALAGLADLQSARTSPGETQTN
ncbi:MAG: tetratricopeptide repeat protein [Planctomycetes bacterium]|nr:tetratricopeptide repeat protein [Planctomycetota bacterium]